MSDLAEVRSRLPRLLFLHIPKTGGVSFEEMLAQIYKPEVICPIYYEEDFLLNTKSLEQFSLFQGHHSYFVRAFLRQPVEAITFLRHPISRAISAFEHIQRDTTHLHHQWLVAAGGTLSAFIEHPILRRHISNVQTRTLGRELNVGSLQEVVAVHQELHQASGLFMRMLRAVAPDAADLARAQERLTSMRFFGLTEEFETSSRMFCETYALPDVPVRRQNEAPAWQSKKRHSYTEADIATVKAVNQLDLLLYDFATDLFRQRLQTRQATQ